MNYAALLFCPDDKTSRVLTQVLSDLEFSVEPCAEAFAAVKKLMAQRFDAVVVDCDNEQNAALMFKSVRNSESNQAALTVAVVGDQAGVAKAFRLGANLVLTKPINVEQSKGTLRVAKGLLKKGEAPKGSVAGPSPAPPVARSSARPAAPPSVVATPKPQIPFPAQQVAPVQKIPAIAASALELDPEPTPQTAPDDAALLESMPAPANPLQNSWPAASESKLAQQAFAQADAHASGAAAAAPAKEIPSAAKPLEQRPAATVFAPAKSAEAVPEFLSHKAAPEPAFHSAAPMFSSASGLDGSDGSEGGSKKFIIGAVAIMAVAAMGYFGYSKSHHRPAAPPVALQQGPQQGQPEPQPVTGTASDLAPAPASSAASVSAVPLATPGHSDKSTVPPTSGTSSTPKPSSSQGAGVAADKTAGKASANSKSAPDEEVAPLMVKNETPQPTPGPVADTPTPDAPDMDVAGNNSSSAISGIVSSVPVTVPKPSAQMMKVSQGISQGLLVKKVDPVYPRQAMQSRIQGSVQLEAIIAKDGSISSVKVLSGDAVLAAAAVDAVRRWKYKPYFLDGQPIEIQTQITMNFTLP